MGSGAILVSEGCESVSPIVLTTQKIRSVAIKSICFRSIETQQALIGFTTPGWGCILALTLFNMFKLSEWPETTVIIDHLDRPSQGRPEEYAVVLD